MAMKWLREVHNIDICVFPYQTDYISYSYKVKIYKNKEIYLTITDSKTYEDAIAFKGVTTDLKIFLIQINIYMAPACDEEDRRSSNSAWLDVEGMMKDFLML